MDFPHSTSTMCLEMYFMCLHNGTVYVNSATTILFRPLRLRVWETNWGGRKKQTHLLLGLFLGFLMVITCYVMSLIYDLKMIEYLRKLYVWTENNNAMKVEGMDINICFGELTIFRSNTDLRQMLKKNKHKFSKFGKLRKMFMNACSTYSSTNIFVYWLLSIKSYHERKSFQVLNAN